MIQALDLARENAMLKDEVERLRRELADLALMTRTEALGSSVMPWPDDDTGLSVEWRRGAMARLMLVMPRYRALEYGFFAGRFAGVPDCKVIVDRRLAERRRGQGAGQSTERRRTDRRSNQPDTAGAVVLAVR